MFFERDEIKLLIGCLLLLFPQYFEMLQKGEFEKLEESLINYYVNCATIAHDYILKPENEKFRKWIVQRGRSHIGITKNLDYGYSGLIYQLYAFEPFKSLLTVELDKGIMDNRPARNLALFSQIISRYEYLHNVTVLTAKNIERSNKALFNTFLRLQYKEGISEYEDEAEYAPSGCVSFLTIHQSKGMEFPIVFVDSMHNVPRKQGTVIMEKIENDYFHRKAYEPLEMIKYYDFWRLYYTAYSRAQNLLILTSNETKRTPSAYFVDVYNPLPNIEDNGFDINEFEVDRVKDVNIKESFSFTSDITLYENCSLQYKFYRELEFSPVRAAAQLFGRLVHETIEDVHKVALKNEKEKITAENVTEWFNTNYENLSKSEHAYLGEPQRNAALKQVLRYIDRNNNTWDSIEQAEVDVSLVRDQYIIDGKIDLIKGDNNTVELVDFKSERKLDLVSDKERLEQYRRQLHVYAYLVEQRYNQKVSKMNLYFTGEENGVPTISYDYSPTAIKGTMESFDDTVQRIMKKDFNTKAKSQKTCDNCDFRFLCGKNRAF